MGGLRIQAAKHGGFAVLMWNGYGDVTDFLFAGSLAECLAFMKAHLENPEQAE